MKKYKYTKNGEVSFMNVSDEKLEEFLKLHPDATLAEGDGKQAFQKGPADVDLAVAPSNNTGSNLVDGSLEPLVTEDLGSRSIKFKDGVTVYEDVYIEKYAGKGSYPKTFDEYAELFKTKPRKAVPADVVLDEVVVEGKTSDKAKFDQKNAVDYVKTIDSKNEVTLKGDIGESYFDLTDEFSSNVYTDGELIPRSIISAEFVNNRPKKNKKTWYPETRMKGQYINSLEEDQKASMGEVKWNQWQAIKKEAGDTVITKDNIAEFIDLAKIDGATKSQVVTAAKKKAAELFIYNEDLTEEEQRDMLMKLPYSSETKSAMQKELDARKQDAIDYKEKTGFPLVQESTLSGRVYKPLLFSENKGMFDEIIAKENATLKTDFEAIQEDSIDFKEAKDKATKARSQYEVKLTEMKDQIDAYSVDVGDYSSQEEVTSRNSLVTEYNKTLALANSEGRESWNELSASREALTERSDALTLKAKKLSDLGIGTEAIGKSYELGDQFAQVMEESFLGTSAMLGGSIFKLIGNIATIGKTEDEAMQNSFYRDMKNAKMAAVDYNARLRARKENYLPSRIEWDDEDAGWGDYISTMLVENSPSILTAMGTLGASSAGVVGLKAATNIGTSIFFTMEAGGQMSQLELAQRNASEVIGALEEELLSTTGEYERSNIFKQIQEQKDVLSLSQWQKSLSSIVYGGTAAIAERFGSLHFINNFQKYSRAVGTDYFKKVVGNSMARTLSKATGAISGVGMGAGIEVLEEGFTLIGQNMSDVAILKEDKNIFEGLDKDFLANTLATSIAISGPVASQSIYSAVKSEVMSRREAREESKMRDEIMGLQNEINGDKLTPEERTRAEKKKKKLMTALSLQNTKVVLKINDMTAEEFEEVTELNREMRALENEAAQLGGQGDVSEYSKKELANLKAQYDKLATQRESLLEKQPNELNKLFPDSGGTNARYAAGLTNFSINIIKNNKGTTQKVFETTEEIIEFVKENHKNDVVKQADGSEKIGWYENQSKADKKVFDEGGFYALNIGNNIYVNKEAISNTIATGDLRAGQMAAMSPLHELGHIQTARAGIIKDGKFVGDAQAMIAGVTREVSSLFNQKKISAEDYKLFKDRMAQYADANTGQVDADELLQLVGDFTNMGILPRSSFNSIFEIKNFVRNLMKRYNGDAEMYFMFDKPENVFGFVNSWTNKALAGKQLAGIVDPDKGSGAFSLDARQDLKWKQTDDALETKFKVGGRDFEMTLEETAFMEFDEGQTYQDIEDIAKELDITEDKDGDGIESSERFFHYEFGDAELGKDVTGTGNALEVFSVAGNGLVDYLNKKKKVEGVIFTAKEPSRIRLYKRLGQTLADEIGGSFGYKNNTFIVSKKPPVKGGVKFSKSTPLEAINDLVPNTVKTQADYFSPRVFNPIYKALDENGVISNYIKSKSPSKEVASKTIESIRERLVNFNPETTRKNKDNLEPITFGEFIFANTNFGKLDAKKKLFKESQEDSNKVSIDSEQAKKIAVTESASKKADTPQYRKIIDSNVLFKDVVSNVKTKVLKTVRTLKSKLDANVSKNKTVTPLIAEIKKEMGKQADIDLKKAIGGKANDQAKRFLTKNKKAILENMTTTWLTQAIPTSIQKMVDGVWTSEWQGKKIDRESAKTDSAGRTSGAEMIRRKPNAANMPDTEFLSYFLDPKGNPIRGRKESLAKAMAEEVSLEIFNKELQDENSDISKAFENNQQLKGVVLAEAYVAEVSKQIERGNVKFSRTLGSKLLQEKSDFYEGIGSERFKETFSTNWRRGSKTPLTDTIIEYFTEFPVKGISNGEIATIAKDFASDYVFAKEEVGVARVLDKESIESTLSHILSQGKGRTERGTSWDDVQRIFEGSVSKLNLKTLGDINEGRQALKKLAYELIKRGFTGNQVYTMLSYSYGPSGLGGFTGVPVKGKKNKRVTPGGVVLIAKELGSINYETNKKTGKKSIANRGALVLNTADFIQNILPKNAKKDGKPTGEVVSIPSNVYKKDSYTEPDSTFNKKSDAEKKKEARRLWKLGETYGKDLVEIIKAIESLDVTSASRRELVTGLFASMSAAGKIPSTVRFYPSKMDGTLLTFSELVKLFGRKDGVIDKGVFEHTKPANRIATAAYVYSLTGSKSDLDILEKELLDYDTAMITYGMDTNLRKLKLQSLMGLNYKAGDAVMGTRYAELITTMEAAGVTFWDAKTGEVISPAGAFGPQFNQELKDNLKPVQSEQKAIDLATSAKFSKSPKKIRVFDFDDTLAQTKSNVLYTMPDGTKGKIDAATFAKDAGKMEAEGAVWDFSEFSKVMNGKAGPLLGVAKIIADKRGTENVFVLTARPQDAAGPIQEFLAELGLDIPLKNITGLADGNPKAKANWMISKVAEGYNDFYFADDHTGNVKAVKELLDTFDVKGKVQLAKVKFSKSLDPEFNSMIERNKGVGASKEFSKIVAKRRGANKGKYKAFITSSADDFRGLTSYTFAGKGKQGEADQAFFEDALLTPYFRGVNALESARVAIKNDFTALSKIFKPEVKKLGKLTPDGDFTYDQAVRVYMWNKQGIEVPGLSKRDQAKLVQLVENDAGLVAFSEAAVLATKKEGWVEPGEYWDAKTLLSDLNDLTETSNRADYLIEFNENADLIFSEKNLNKVEAVYGTRHREALEDALYAMKNGTNRTSGSNKITNGWNNWVNSSIGTIMFFNRRSATMQLLSSFNFLNWSDNNPLKAGIAFANQPQYWKDFSMIFNSDKLKQRRGGLKSDVQEAEIANAAKGAKNKPQAIISYLLKKGFAPTQIADSFAISMGGASMYRNRVNTYKKQGLDQKAAEDKAFLDFSKLSDETQQSGDPALVSQQQRSVAGRLILSFQNTTMQYTRLMKKSAQDLANGRGDPKTHISKILYYGAIQNFLFNALSTSLFALIPGFEDEDDEKVNEKELDKKSAKILHGMFDGIAKGTGIHGAVLVTLKNAYIKYAKEKEKGYMGQPGWEVASELLNIAPAIGSKFKKVKTSIDVAEKYDKDIIEKHPWDVNIGGKFNPSSTYTVIGGLSSALLNLPLDRALIEARGISEMLDDRNTNFQKIALGLGWRTWDVGAKNEEFDLIKAEAKVARKEENERKAKETKAKNKEEEKRLIKALEYSDYKKFKKATKGMGLSARVKWLKLKK